MRASTWKTWRRTSVGSHSSSRLVMHADILLIVDILLSLDIILVVDMLVLVV